MDERRAAGDVDGAVPDFDWVINLQPGRAPGAERDFAECLKLDPGMKARLEGRIREAKEARERRAAVGSGQ